MIILVYFSAPHGRPHHPFVMKLYEVVKDMHPMHQELSNTLSPNLLAQFVKEILTLHGPFSWEKWAKATTTYHVAENRFFSKSSSGNISLRMVLHKHTCLLRKTEEKSPVKDQITWRFSGWHMHGYSGIHPVGQILKHKIGYVRARVKLLQLS